MVKFLLIVLAVSFVLRTVVPWLMRFFLGRFLKQQMRGFGGAGAGGGATRPGGGPRRERPTGRPGEVRVEYAPPPKARKPRPEGYRGGDYVEFEDVK